jgi:hypothetical protein
VYFMGIDYGPISRLASTIDITHNVLSHKRATLIAYLQEKTKEGDWHAVSDAANDLRVLEADALARGVRFS